MKSFLKFQVVVFFISLSLQNVCAQQQPPFWDDIQNFKKQDSLHFPPKHAILFVGSSSFTKWTDVQDYFPGYTIINRSFGGSSLPDVIRYAYDIIFPYHPKQVVIYCGENDLAASDTVSAATVFDRFRQLYYLIRKKIPNIPDDPNLALNVGRKLCTEVLEPIQERFGRICVRSAYRSSAVNAKGAENNNRYRCAGNRANHARHIWDVRDDDKKTGAMACIVVTSFLPYYERTKNWQALAWWVHDNVPGYSEMEFFRRLAAFNISWHEEPKKTIHTQIPPTGCVTKPGMDNQQGSHEKEYREWLAEYDA